MAKAFRLDGLQGTNPLGFLGAIGVLDVLTRAGRAARLAFADELVPVALVEGADDLDDLVGVLDRDRATWVHSVVLRGPHARPLNDANPDVETATMWSKEVADTLIGGRAEADLYCALVAEGAMYEKVKDGKSERRGKPTHLHFTSGPQQFLKMARELAAEVDVERLREAIAGPWRDDSKLPSLRWDGRGSRPYSLRATKPLNAALSVPGADWLALLGLASLPVRAVPHRFKRDFALQTTACDPQMDRSAFRWPLWSPAISLAVVRSLLSDPAVVGTEEQRRRANKASAWPDFLARRGVVRVLEAPIDRPAKYGNFGGAVTLAEATRSS